MYSNPNLFCFGGLDLRIWALGDNKDNNYVNVDPFSFNFDHKTLSGTDDGKFKVVDLEVYEIQ